MSHWCTMIQRKTDMTSNVMSKMSYRGGHDHRSPASSHRHAFVPFTSGSRATHEHDCPAQKLILFPSIAPRCSFSLKSYALILHCPREEWTVGTQRCKETSQKKLVAWNLTKLEIVPTSPTHFSVLLFCCDLYDYRLISSIRLLSRHKQETNS